MSIKLIQNSTSVGVDKNSTPIGVDFLKSTPIGSDKIDSKFETYRCQLFKIRHLIGVDINSTTIGVNYSKFDT